MDSDTLRDCQAECRWPHFLARQMVDTFILMIVGLVMGICIFSAPLMGMEGAHVPPPGMALIYDPRFTELVSSHVELEKIADGHVWAEGPVWNAKDGSLLYSDVPRNSVYRWSEASGVTVFLHPSGFAVPENFTGRQPGSNGLAFDRKGRLILCEHGNRRVTRIEMDGTRTTLADQFNGKRLNSPNDLTLKSNGDMYFTDPPYGLPGGFKSEQKELSFQGVYRLTSDGELTLLTKTIYAPNGLAFSPDEKTLYVTNSDGERPAWLAFDVTDDGRLTNKRVFFDARPLRKNGKGAPDGLKVDQQGNIFSSGPGGVYVFSPEGVLLGFINIGTPTSNVNWGEDGSVLFITAQAAVYRVPLRTRGHGF